jgi:hypothetical protein
MSLGGRKHLSAFPVLPFLQALILIVFHHHCSKNSNQKSASQKWWLTYSHRVCIEVKIEAAHVNGGGD